MKTRFIDETGDHSLSKIDNSYPLFVLSGVVTAKDRFSGMVSHC